MGKRKPKAPAEPRPIPGPRGSTCPSMVHDWPLPEGKHPAVEECRRRMRHGWQYVTCTQCSRHGWLQGGAPVAGTTAEHWQPQTLEHPKREQRSGPT